MMHVEAVHSSTDGVTCVLYSSPTQGAQQKLRSASLVAGTKTRAVCWTVRPSPTTRLNRQRDRGAWIVCRFLHSRLRQVHIRDLSYKIPYITCTTALLNICPNLQRLSANCFPSVRRCKDLFSFETHESDIRDGYKDAATATDRDHTESGHSVVKHLLLSSVFCILFGLIFSTSLLNYWGRLIL
jgi:hypothetical protein